MRFDPWKPSRRNFLPPLTVIATTRLCPANRFLAGYTVMRFQWEMAMENSQRWLG